MRLYNLTTIQHSCIAFSNSKSLDLNVQLEINSYLFVIIY